MLTGRKLLLADDSLTIQKVVSLTFSDEAMEVVVVGSGAEALEHLRGSLPDIILADVLMPEPNGYKLCERIKADQQTRHIPVVLLVGTFEPFNEAEARRVGADEVLTKPFQSIRDLVNKVGGLLGGSDEKPLDGEEARDARREEATTRDLSPFAAEARDAAPTGESPSAATAAADAFNDFDLDDATIQSTPVAAFDARAQATSSAFSEIREEERFSDRGETDEAFVLEDDESPLQTHAAAAAGASTSYAASSTTSTEVFPVAGTAFSAHAARSAEADDALLELGDIAPAHGNAATAEADDFILDIGDDSFDSPVAVAQPTPAQAAEADMFFAEQAQTTEVPEAFDPLDMLGTGIESAPALFAPEPQEFEATRREVEAAPYELESASQELEAPEMTEAPSLLFATETEPEAPAVQASVQAEEEVSAPVWDGEPAAASAVAHAGGIAAFVETPVESQPVSIQESATAARVEAPEQSQSTTPSSSLSPEMLDEVVRRVVAHMSEQLVREIAWEVVPDLAERLIKQRLEEEKTRTTP